MLSKDRDKNYENKEKSNLGIDLWVRNKVRKNAVDNTEIINREESFRCDIKRSNFLYGQEKFLICENLLNGYLTRREEDIKPRNIKLSFESTKCVSLCFSKDGVEKTDIEGADFILLKKDIIENVEGKPANPFLGKTRKVQGVGYINRANMNDTKLANKLAEYKLRNYKNSFRLIERGNVKQDKIDKEISKEIEKKSSEDIYFESSTTRSLAKRKIESLTRRLISMREFGSKRSPILILEEGIPFKIKEFNKKPVFFTRLTWL